MTKNILIYEGEIFDDLKKKLQKRYTLKDTKFLKKNYLKKILGLIVNLENYYTKKNLKLFPNLKFILSPTTGINHLDQIYCKKKKIKIFKLERNDFFKKKIYSTAELTLTLILMSVKKISFFNNLTKNFIWDRYKYGINQFNNYTVGIIGNGRVGSILKSQLKLLRFKVVTYDKKKKSDSLNYLLKKSDIISLHIPSQDNKNFFNKNKLRLCKKDVILINTSRGEIINEKDLITFLKNNKKSCAYLDVIDNEQKNLKDLKKNKILRYQKKYDNLYITPHIGGVSIEARKQTQEIIINKFLNFTKNDYTKF